MSDGTEEFYDGLLKVIQMVKSNRDSWPFKEPVDAREVPQYYQVIKKPIDLATIEDKILSRQYSKLKHVEKDFKQLVNNCETFNGDRNGFTIMAYAVWRTFRRAVARHLDGRELRRHEEDTFIYTPPKITANRPPVAAIKARKRRKAGGGNGSGTSKTVSHAISALDEMAAASEAAIREAESSLAECAINSSSNADLQSGPNSSLKNDEAPHLGEKDVKNEPLDENGNSFDLSGPSTSANTSSSSTSSSANTTSGSEETIPRPPCPENGNLVFKSLSEWSACQAEPITLPQNAFRFASHDETGSRNPNRPLHQVPLETDRTQLSTVQLSKHKPMTKFVSSSSSSSSNCGSDTERDFSSDAKSDQQVKQPKLPNLIIKLGGDRMIKVKAPLPSPDPANEQSPNDA